MGHSIHRIRPAHDVHLWRGDPNQLVKSVTLTALESADVDIFTVTGAVLMRCWGYVTTSGGVTGGPPTVDLGTATDDNVFGSVAANALMVGEIYLGTTSADTVAGIDVWGHGVLVSETVSLSKGGTGTITGGAMSVYCHWLPLTANANVAVA